MSEIQTVKNTVRGVVEDTAEEFVVADLSDASVLDNLMKTFAGIAQDLDAAFPRCAAAARYSEKLLQKGAESGGGINDDDAAAVEQTISALQALANQDLAEDELEFPESFGLKTGPVASDGTTDDGSSCLTSVVDHEILEEYLAQQDAVVSEMEELVLSFEQNADADVLKALKRLLHTAKGEAGVIGLFRIEKVCHRVEDYIQEAGEDLQADLLLEFKDWFEQTMDAIRHGTQPPSPDNLLAAFQAPEQDGIKDGQAVEPASAQNQEDETASPESKDGVDGGGEKTAASGDQTAGEPEDPAAADDEYAELLSPVVIEDPEITADFVSETNEHFEVADENLMTLESDPENEEATASIFRAFHTIKGTTSFLGLTPISVLAHKAENLLDEVRKKRLPFDGLVVDATFNALDLLKTMTKDLENVLAAGEMFVPDPQLPAVFEQLQQALSGQIETGAPAGKKPADTADSSDTDESDGTEVDPFAAAGAIPEAAAEPEKAGGGNGGGGPGRGGKTVKQTMKIDADRIDLLLETIGELVIVESIVSQEAALRQGESRELERNLGQLTKITRSLQDMGMSMRLIPIDNTFRKMGRLVRDLAKKSGKKIELSMEGRETELDKGMVEKLGDPLVHMIRNAVDHGIEETVDDRVAAGKDPTGKILLNAYHQGGNIHIDIIDDGRGLDRDALAAKAIDRGIVSSAENMSDEEIFALIFEPGFSTAKQVTDVSGRGVGMDVVKSNIENMRGNVRIASKKGEGSTFTLVLPLTMAIIDGMIVRVGRERYILPLLSIIESFQPTPEMITTVSGKGETVPFRNRLLPLFRLARLFNVADAQTEPTKALVVVIEDAGRLIALLVDELLGQNQTVIKNLGEGLKDVDGIAGASIMADGTPGLIIDVNGLVKLATG
ncbi:MAG: Hpt domain-containing protein [Thermodesulfobacteriota bacterium]